MDIDAYNAEYPTLAKINCPGGDCGGMTGTPIKELDARNTTSTGHSSMEVTSTMDATQSPGSRAGSNPKRGLEHLTAGKRGSPSSEGAIRFTKRRTRLVVQSMRHHQNTLQPGKPDLSDSDDVFCDNAEPGPMPVNFFLPQNLPPSTLRALKTYSSGQPQFPNERVSLVALQDFLKWDEDFRERNRQAKNDRRLAWNLLEFILTPTQLSMYDYLVPSYLTRGLKEVSYRGRFSRPPVKDASWVETPMAALGLTKKRALALEKPRRVLALDCEMVMCGEESVLAMICVVDFFSRRILYQKYVAPPGPVTDYKTSKSGITAKTLEGVTTSLSDVQHELLYLIGDSNTVLLGHSLNSDLQAIKLSHPRVIDTSILFDPPSGPRTKGNLFGRPSLKWLMKSWLGTDIQISSHDPSIDAASCIELIRAKVIFGSSFGAFEHRLPFVCPYPFHPGVFSVPYVCPCPCPSLAPNPQSTWYSTYPRHIPHQHPRSPRTPPPRIPCSPSPTLQASATKFVPAPKLKLRSPAASAESKVSDSDVIYITTRRGDVSPDACPASPGLESPVLMAQTISRKRSLESSPDCSAQHEGTCTLEHTNIRPAVRPRLDNPAKQDLLEFLFRVPH